MTWENTKGEIVDTQKLITAFSNLDPSDFNGANHLFEEFGPGNVYFSRNPSIMIVYDKTLERFQTYENILHALQFHDTEKYRQIHKGTPYYYLSWLAFTMKDYVKSVFYMDAAVGEDIRAASQTSDSNSWKTTPAASFIFVNDENKSVTGSAITVFLTRLLEKLIAQLNTSAGSSLTLQSFREKFVMKVINEPGWRSIITGFYAFVLDFEKRKSELTLVSENGVSILPYIQHLFSGALVFESMLKSTYGSSGSDLGRYLGASASILEISSKTPLYLRSKPGVYTLPMVVDLLPSWTTEDYKEKIIAVAYAVRNTTGHDLSWPVNFTPEVYDDLHTSICHAILWYVWKVNCNSVSK